MNLILLGAPGAGKGTQGALLAKDLGVLRVSTGDLLREAVREGTGLGTQARQFMDRGELVPDHIILGLVREVLERTPTGVIFDGFPRTLPQAEGLDRLLLEMGRHLDAVILIEVPDDVLVRRLSGRRSCPACGAVYNIYFDPPKVPGVCDRCGGALVERADDDPATVRRRLQVYKEQTEPLIAYYRASPVPLHTVDGDRPIERVLSDAKEALAR